MAFSILKIEKNTSLSSSQYDQCVCVCDFYSIQNNYKQRTCPIKNSIKMLICEYLYASMGKKNENKQSVPNQNEHEIKMKLA